MLIDLTTIVPKNSPLIEWANSQDNQHIAMGHVGTHLDTYEKTTIPIEYFKSNGVIFDVRNIPELGLDDIDLTCIPDNAFVLFRTGQIENHAYGDKEYFNNHPQLSNNLINALINKQIRFIGIDCAGIRCHSEHESADRLCEQNNIYVIENLHNLDKINSSIFTVYTLWLDDPTLTGLRCRVIIEE